MSDTSHLLFNNILLNSRLIIQIINVCKLIGFKDGCGCSCAGTAGHFSSSCHPLLWFLVLRPLLFFWPYHMFLLGSPRDRCLAFWKIQNNKFKILFIRKISALPRKLIKRDIVFCWILCHIGIHGNTIVNRENNKPVSNTKILLQIKYS